MPVHDGIVADDCLEYIAWQNLPPEERWLQATSLLVPGTASASTAASEG